MGGVNEHGQCYRCERFIEADSPSDCLCLACYEKAVGSVPFDAGQAVFTAEEWTEIMLDVEFERYLHSARDGEAGERS